VLKDITALVQARTSSKRLPGKVLKNIGKKTILEMVLSNISNSKYIREIIVLTSFSKSDDKIINLCKKKKFKFIRGPLNNVSLRYLIACKKIKTNYFMRVSADSPFILTSLVDKLSLKVKEKSPDMATNILIKSFPKGQSIEILNKNIFMKYYYKFKTKRDFEHVTPYFYRNRKKFKIFSFRNKTNYKNINLSVDNFIDYKRSQYINKKLTKNISLKKLIKLYYEFKKI
tara:strand:+ start:1269 stop:1955 length:687 start_codon:yes stop_codon:yes gene_type:complete